MNTTEEVTQCWKKERADDLKIAEDINADHTSPHSRGVYAAIVPLLGGCLQWEMDLAAMTQAELSRKSCVSKGVINNIIKGRTTHPSVWTMARLAKALKCNIDSLVSRKAQYVNTTSQQEQAIISIYREGHIKYRRLLDLIVDWDAEDAALSPDSKPAPKTL